MTRMFTALLLGAGLALTTVSCREEGAAEKAGREIDEAMEEARGEMGKAMDKASEALDEAAQEMETDED